MYTKINMMTERVRERERERKKKKEKERKIARKSEKGA